MRNLLTIRQANMPDYISPVCQEHEYEYEAEETLLTFPGMSMSAFMQHTMAYEDLPVPFARRLRQGTSVGISMTLFGTACMLLLLFFPQIQVGLDHLPILVLADLLHSDVQWMVSTALLVITDGLLLGSSIFLLIVTRYLQAGKPALHWLALALALGGCANVLLLALPLAILALNALLWLLILLLVLIVMVLVLGLLVAALR